jgi:adenosylcobinamide kinase/adenosylcobinamide-phosphate guanylyltransferase
MKKKAELILITGGQRSGKSSYAQKIALERATRPIYLATSRVWDEEHRQRIERHKIDRGTDFDSIEEEKEISKYDFFGRVVLLDCITLWLNNFYFDNDNDIELSLTQAKAEFDKLMTQNAIFVVVTNELGMGGHPTNDIQRKFTDLQGWMNQYIASIADEVVLMVSGIPVKIKNDR